MITVFDLSTGSVHIEDINLNTETLKKIEKKISHLEHDHSQDCEHEQDHQDCCHTHSHHILKLEVITILSPRDFLINHSLFLEKDRGRVNNYHQDIYRPPIS